MGVIACLRSDELRSARVRFERDIREAALQALPLVVADVEAVMAELDTVLVFCDIADQNIAVGFPFAAEHWNASVQNLIERRFRWSVRKALRGWPRVEIN